MANGDFKKKLYNSARWKKVRKQVLQRDFYICQICRKENSKVCHHIVELNEQNISDASIATNINNIITVCNQCHDEIHSRNNRHEKRDYYFDADGNFVNEKEEVLDDNKYKKDYTEEQREKIDYYKRMLK